MRIMNDLSPLAEEFVPMAQMNPMQIVNSEDGQEVVRINVENNIHDDYNIGSQSNNVEAGGWWWNFESVMEERTDSRLDDRNSSGEENTSASEPQPIEIWDDDQSGM
jgi:hypothetical protein